jgi:hypothetical protein
MTTEKEINDLWESVVVSIGCAECKKELIGSDDWQLAGKAYKLGWRDLGWGALCPTCIKNKK